MPLEAWVQLIIGIICYTLDVRVQLTDLAIYDAIIPLDARV